MELLNMGFFNSLKKGIKKGSDAFDKYQKDAPKREQQRLNSVKNKVQFEKSNLELYKIKLQRSKLRLDKQRNLEAKFNNSPRKVSFGISDDKPKKKKLLMYR